MSVECIIICDLCGECGAAAETRAKSLNLAREEGWVPNRRYGKIRHICKWCIQRKGLQQAITELLAGKSHQNNFNGPAEAKPGQGLAGQT